MRTSILSRSVIAVATLAIGSVALAAAPATAATPNGITREMVLTAAASLRTDRANDLPEYSDAAKAALLALSSRVCDLSGATDVQSYGWALETPGSVDALAVRTESEHGDVSRDCSFTAIASTDATLRLSGTMTVANYTSSDASSGEVPFTLSGDVFVSTPVSIDNGYAYAGLKATGSAIGSTKIVRTYQVPNSKTTSDKVIARKMYKTRVTNAKRAYVKALKKADSKAQKKAAKKAYTARKAHATSKYQQAVAGYKVATERTVQDVVRPFSVRVAPPLA